MIHEDGCNCLDCWMEIQQHRVQATLSKPTARMRALKAERRKRLKVSHDEMIVGYHRRALPNLDYYDNR